MINKLETALDTLRPQLQEDPTTPTVWFDGRTLGYNPEFIAGLSHEQIIGVILHEIMHWLVTGKKEPKL